MKHKNGQRIKFRKCKKQKLLPKVINFIFTFWAKVTHPNVASKLIAVDDLKKKKMYQNEID